MRRLYCLLILLIGRSGCIDFTITPPCARPGEEGTLTMECVITETDVTMMYNIKIKRETTPGNRSMELLASFEHSEARPDKRIANNKSFTVAGNMTVDKPFLRVTMNTQTMTWSDARNYVCEMAYDSRVSGKIEVQNKNATLTVCEMSERIGASSGVTYYHKYKTEVIAGVNLFILFLFA